MAKGTPVNLISPYPTPKHRLWWLISQSLDAAMLLWVPCEWSVNSPKLYELMHLFKENIIYFSLLMH